MEAVMILRGADPSWAESKRQLGEQDFIKQLINFDKDNISDKTLKKISQYCAQDDFHPDVVGKMIKKSKEKFKVGLLSDTEEFKRAVSHLLQDLQTNGPFAAHLQPQEALDILNNFREQLDNLKKHELELRHGLNLFKIEQPPCKEIVVIEKDLDLLTTIWSTNLEWDKNWESWKVGRFYDLQTNDMENLANTVFRKFAKWSRDLKVSCFVKN
ncbi:unnamed protein product [Trichobilharzia regenti]|nr:unnamed protein product [Trichobilharzia regenti]